MRINTIIISLFIVSHRYLYHKLKNLTVSHHSLKFQYYFFKIQTCYNGLIDSIVFFNIFQYFACAWFNYYVIYTIAASVRVVYACLTNDGKHEWRTEFGHVSAATAGYPLCLVII